MAEFGEAGSEVNARIAYWGVEGAGKETNLRVIHSKLRPDHRGDLREEPTRLDPTVTYLTMPIELGDLGGVRTRIQVFTTPGAPEHAPTRKQLLDQVDGVVFVVDTLRDRLEANLASFEELRASLADYGRSLEDVPLVIQYNKRDQSDPYVLEELHRKLHMSGVAAFEAVAEEGTAVLQTLTTVSKRVIRTLRERPQAPETDPLMPAGPDITAPVTPPEPPTLELDPEADLEAASDDSGGAAAPLGAGLDPELLRRPAEADPNDETAARTQLHFDPSFSEAEAALTEAPLDLEIESVGQATVADPRTVRVPVTLRDATGRRMRVALSVRIDPAPENQDG